MARWAGWISGGAVALLLCASRGRADSSNDAEHARLASLLSEGADSAKAKRWSTCVEALTAALAIESAPVTLGELGLCEEASASYALAHAHLRRALEQAPAAPADQKDPWKRYQSALERVTARVALVFVTTDPPSARVVLDGRPLGTADGRGVAVLPGAHTLSARLEGYEDKVEERVMRAHDMPNIHLKLAPKPKGPLGLPSLAPRDTVSPEAVPGIPAPGHRLPWYEPAWTVRGSFVTLGYAALLTTAAAGATAIGLEVDRASLQRSLAKDTCSPVTPGPFGVYVNNPSRPPQCTALHERALQQDTAVDVTIGAGIATGVLAAAILVSNVLDRGPAQPSIAPAADKHGGGIVVFGSW